MQKQQGTAQKSGAVVAATPLALLCSWACWCRRCDKPYPGSWVRSRGSLITNRLNPVVDVLVGCVGAAVAATPLAFALLVGLLVLLWP